MLYESGDQEAYKQLREQMLRQFGGTSDPAIAERTAKEFLMVPPLVSDMVAISNLTETCVAAGPQNIYWKFFEQIKGLTEYREGHFADAVNWTQKILDDPRTVPLLAVDAYAVLAMVH